MADEHELRELHEEIDASVDEMARYRAKLAETLDADSPTLRRWRWLALAVPVAAAILLWMYFTPLNPSLDQHSLEELQTLVASSTDQAGLVRLARRGEASGNELTRYNANMLLCMTSSDGQALLAAAHGATTDPRAEFRAWYLEYLLDYADSFELDPDGIERRMEEETDAGCLKLYSRLLRMAERGAAITA